MRKLCFLPYLIFGLLMASCSSYKQNIMFKAKGDQGYDAMVHTAESNYTIQKNDLLSLDVFTNLGEKIVDPSIETSTGTGKSSETKSPITYLVDVNGIAKFPMINQIKVEGLTIKQAEEILQKEYTRFYNDAYVVLKFTNKRVVLLGAPGGQVIPLLNENTKLTEVLALAKGIGNDAKAHNIRIIRNDKIFVIDLSSINNYAKNDIIMMPNDIVYIEPVRRPFSEGLREYGPILSIITSLGTLIIVIMNSNNN